jgi:hypothetical protein
MKVVTYQVDYHHNVVPANAVDNKVASVHARSYEHRCNQKLGPHDAIEYWSIVLNGHLGSMSKFWKCKRSVVRDRVELKFSAS